MALNRGPFVGASPPLEPLETFDGQVLDVRSPYEFAAGHLAGALNVPVSGPSLGTKAGFLLDADRPVALHASSREEVDAAAARLRAVGLLDLAGFLTAPAATEQMEPIGVDELERLLAEDAVEVIDVREKNERDEGYIPGQPQHPLPARGRVRGRARERQDGRHGLRERRARRGRRERPRRARDRGPTAPRRRHPGLASAWQRRHQLPALRLG